MKTFVSSTTSHFYLIIHAERRHHFLLITSTATVTQTFVTDAASRQSIYYCFVILPITESFSFFIFQNESQLRDEDKVIAIDVDYSSSLHLSHLNFFRILPLTSSLILISPQNYHISLFFTSASTPHWNICVISIVSFSYF